MTDPATDKQIAFMKTLGIEIPNNCTKETAKVLISDKLGDDEPKKDEKTQPKASKGEFHLSPEQINSNALFSALKYYEQASIEGYSHNDVLKMANVFRAFIA